LILDHAERLLSLSARKKKNEKTNFLAELLLLPKVMKLNLTVIIISTHSTLNDSRKCRKGVYTTFAFCPGLQIHPVFLRSLQD
jgi:hypothetical protein